MEAALSTRLRDRAAVCLALLAVGCSETTAPTMPEGPSGDLEARPHAPTGALLAPGEHVLELGLNRNPVVYLPPNHDPSVPAPLVVLFHGAGGSAEDWGAVYQHADRLGMVLLMIQSRFGTWDVLVEGGFGSDRTAVDRALTEVFDRCAVDAGMVAFVGFSDGASYALSLGLGNPELVRHVVAFSPGFQTGTRGEPRARVFISHGNVDPVLSVDATRRLVQSLEHDGYDVTYREFAGGHFVPLEIHSAAFDWLAPVSSLRSDPRSAR